jgi:uncharacterized membrane protein
MDAVRTLAIGLMVLYHLAFDLQYWYGWRLGVQHSGWETLGRISAILFLALVGVSFAVSIQGRAQDQIWKRTFRRAGIILGWAMAISAATYMMEPSTFIRFGILHCIGLSLLLLPMTRQLGYWNVLIGIVWIAVSPYVQGMPVTGDWLLVLGRMPPGFISLDYYPFFPWTGIILIGAGIGACIRLPDVSHAPARLAHLLTAPGRHSLAAYLLHQPILLAVLWILHAL